MKCGLEKTVGDYIEDNYITVLPEDARKSMIFLGENSISYKAGNVKIDLKKAVIAGLEFAASISKLQFKKTKNYPKQVNEELLNGINNGETTLTICNALATEMNEMWSFYHRKSYQIWLWWAVEYSTICIFEMSIYFEIYQ